MIHFLLRSQEGGWMT